jgi:hypothetical protein
VWEEKNVTYLVTGCDELGQAYISLAISGDEFSLHRHGPCLRPMGILRELIVSSNGLIATGLLLLGRKNENKRIAKEMGQRRDVVRPRHVKSKSRSNPGTWHKATNALSHNDRMTIHYPMSSLGHA